MGKTSDDISKRVTTPPAHDTELHTTNHATEAATAVTSEPATAHAPSTATDSYKQHPGGISPSFSCSMRVITR